MLDDKYILIPKSEINEVLKRNIIELEKLGETYSTSEIKVSVYQKDNSPTVPVCYCFDWTREKISKYVEDGIGSKPLEHIRQNVKENRCGCEVNNPQGSCCMGNVTKFIKSL